VHERRPRYLFLAEQQLPGAPAMDLTYFVRCRGTIDATTPLVTKSIAEADASLPIVAMSTMKARLENMAMIETLLLQLVVAFAAVSLSIAALGQYAVAMFNTRRRTRDFGVRLALGASASQIQRSVLREALQLTLPGLLIGFGLSVATAIGFRSVLFGVTPVDPPTYAAVALVLTLASLVASLVPARRAATVNVVDALRAE
jgi:ABC-type antimicrobial peptide transport system permease subunit